MPVKHRLMDKAPPTREPVAKKARTAQAAESAGETALARIESVVTPARGDGGGSGDATSAGAGAVVPIVTKGKGRGLKAVQLTKEKDFSSERPDGSKVQAKGKIKEQKLYLASSNAHVETKVVKEDKRKTVRKDGTVVMSQSTTMKKVCYL
mmetsp:Transcript_59875/g.128463  ORF Transcript_59875/g.128463 Transcript_59875/m.128463 type:complete len:151 (-) Transcript_59875:234-686(-)